jgi:lysophospholipase L1-like esterase
MDYSMLDFLSALRGTLSALYRRYPDIPVVYVIPLQQTHAIVIRRLMAEYPRGYVVESEGWPMSYTDGIHPNAASAKRMGENVAKAIRELGVLRI